MKDFGFDPPSIAGNIQVMEGLDLRVEFVAVEAPCSVARNSAG